MDLRTTVIESLDKLISSGKVEALVEKYIEATIDSLLKEALRSYGDFGKAIEAKLGEALKLHGDVTIPEYNEVILRVIRNQFEAKTLSVVEKQVAHQLNELLTPVPESINLSALVAAYIERFVEEKKDDGDYFEGGDITFFAETERGGFTYFALDPTYRTKKYECEIRFGVYKERIHHLEFKDKEIEKRLFAGPFYGFQRMIFQLKAAQSRIVFDKPFDEIETYYSGSTD
ncbi:MAG: hypothetical protein IT428_16180 [Planctomycetaceae bacterium]|nr:hypothetical protein [Planctomycetaceae bacterium]